MTSVHTFHFSSSASGEIIIRTSSLLLFKINVKDKEQKFIAFDDEGVGQQRNSSGGNLKKVTDSGRSVVACLAEIRSP